MLIVAAGLFTLIVYVAIRHRPEQVAVVGGGGGEAFVEPPIVVPDFSVPVGRMRLPLPYRIVSFHRGRADKNLIKLAAQLGFNGVQFQIEGSTEGGVQEFVQRDAREHLIDYCHKLGMKVTVWVHEMSDLPPSESRNYLGPVAADNEKLFAFLDERYERMLTKTIPTIDGLVLTVVETQVRATDAQILERLAKMLAAKCAKHNKSLIVRTFVWYPGEFRDVMAAIGRLAPNQVIMSKVVPQDWQMRGTNAPEIGAVGGRPQIIEYDVCGEYFHKSNVANCMVDLLKRQFDYGLSKGAQGICVRVDRGDASVLFEPNEVNLWALGLMAAGVTDKADDIWAMWANWRYGSAAAPLVINALKSTSLVVTEITSLGPFTFGDTRIPPPLPDDPDILLMNWQNWRWDADYLPAYYAADRGDLAFITQVAKQKQVAAKAAEDCLAYLELARTHLPPAEYEILYTRLLTNQTQLATKSAMQMATLYYRAMIHATTQAQRKAWREAMRPEIDRVRLVAGEGGALGREPMVVEHMGRKWQLGVPTGLTRQALEHWAAEADTVVTGEHIPHSTAK